MYHVGVGRGVRRQPHEGVAVGVGVQGGRAEEETGAKQSGAQRRSVMDARVGEGDGIDERPQDMCALPAGVCV